MQRIIGQHQTMRRLLRLGAGHSAVPLHSIEEVFERQIGFGFDGTRASPSSTAATKPAGAAAAVATDKLHSVPRHLLSMAVWRVLQHDCYFARKQTPSSTTTTAAAADAAAAGDVSGQSLCVVPLSWRGVLERLAAQIPYEGWTEAAVLAHLQSTNPIWVAFPPLWLPAYGSGATSFPAFVRQHFSTVLTITRSAVTGELLFHRAGHNSVAVTWRPSGAAAGAEAESVAVRPSEVCDAVQHALHTLGRGHQLPLWTDVAAVAPLLPVRTGLSSGSTAAWHAAFVQNAELRGCFRLEAYVRVRASPSWRRWTVVVDSTTLTPAEVTALLTAAAATAAAEEGGAAPPTSVQLLRRAGTPREAYQRACCAAAGPATLVQDVIVDALLEPQHLLAALVESVAAEVAQKRPGETSTAASNGGARARVPDVDGGDVDAAEEEDEAADELPGEEEAVPASPATAVSSATTALVLCGASAKAAFAAVLAEVHSPLVTVSLVAPVADA